MKIFKNFILIFSLISMLGIRGIAQENQTYFLHTVQSGQSLYSIANMYNVSVSEINKLNPGSDEAIYAGQILRIPQQKSKDATSFFHTIQSGETLYRLTVIYKVSAQDICSLNPGLNADNFHAGEVIRIPIKSENNNIANSAQGNKATVQATKKSSDDVSSSLRYKDIHKAKKKETIYSIAKKYKITIDELLAVNPGLKEKGLQKDDMIYIPYPSPKKAAEPIPTDKELFTNSNSYKKKIGTIKAALILPFTKDNRMVEYYEGFLIAADSLKHCGVSMDIYAYDADTDIQSLISSKSELADMDVIFGPLDKDQIKPLSTFAKNHKIRLVIPFTSKDEEVFNNPYIYQINTPQLYLYSCVYNHFLKQFKKPNVIFIESSTSDKSKEQFIRGMKNELTRKGVIFTSISDGASLEDMSDALFSDHENIFIPTSGNHVTLIKILPKLELLVRNNRTMNIQLFGYPEWQTVTREHLKQFFTVNTYFYSSFYTNSLLPESKRFEKNFQYWYHKLMENRYPKYGMLGFDTGFFFLKGLSQYGSAFDENVHKLKPTPVQTGLYFNRVNNWGGFINQKVFFIHYTPQSEVVKLDFD
jgi:LysM repeat protein